MRAQLPSGYVRFYENGSPKSKSKSKLLRLPQEVARLVSVDQVWKITADNDGIHLNPVAQIEQELPAWAAAKAADEAGVDLFESTTTPEGGSED